MQLDPSIFALGGMAAIVAAGWTQVKAVLNQLRSILIVRGYMVSGLNSYVSMHLRKEWKQLPTSDVDYGVAYITLGRELVSRMIAFRLPPYKVSIFYKGWRFVILSDDQTLLTIRGMVNLDKLILAGVALHYEFMSSKDRPDRYYHRDVVGLDAKFIGGKSRGGGGVEASDSDAPRSIGDRSAREPDPQFDKPLGYTRDQVLNKAVKPDPFETLVYEPDIMRHIEQAQQWFNRRDWYNERGIPWRRGWLLSGPAGTGKSRLCKALAQKLRIPIYSFHLNTLSDQEFMDEWRQLPMPCVVVFEDFDNVFNGRTNVKENSTLSFDCVLNQISGIGTNDGLFLIVTTNHPEKLDPAMGCVASKVRDPEAPSFDDEEDEGLSSRPGRIDVSLYLGYMTIAGKRRMAERTLVEWPESIERVMRHTEELTPAQFQELCVREAQRQLAKEEAQAQIEYEETT